MCTDEPRGAVGEKMSAIPENSATPDSLKLNIGAGRTYLPGFRNIDLADRADIQLDLNLDRLPFDDDSVDLVFTYHALEHLDRYLFALGEIHRVLKHGAALLVGVPYVTLTEYNLVNPYHRQHFNEYSFDFFDPDKLKGTAVEANDILLIKAFHRFHYMEEFVDADPEERDWARRHLFNVVRKIDFGLVAVKDRDRPVRINEELAGQLEGMFDACLASRISYPETVLLAAPG